MVRSSDYMNPCFVGRNAALLQFSQFPYLDESTRWRMSNVATPKSGRFEEEWAKLNIPSNVMSGKVDLRGAALIVLNVEAEFTATGRLLTRDAPAPFRWKEVVVKSREQEGKSAGELIVPKQPAEEMEADERGLSESKPMASEKTKNRRRIYKN